MMKKLSPVLLTVLLPAVMAGLRIDVTNPEFERTYEPVICKLTHEQLAEADGCALFELDAKGGKKAVPFSIARLEDAAYLCFVMYGLTDAGAMRSFVLEAGKPSKDMPTDLAVAEDKDCITIGNQYFTTSHKKLGGGSLPRGFTFNLSGNSNPELGFYDRIAKPSETGPYPIAASIGNDMESTARLLFSSPLMAIVEVHAKYRSSKDAEEKGNPRATYRFFYNCATPLVHAEIVAEQDEAIYWNEFYFLHLTHIKRERYYKRNVVGLPLEMFDYQPIGGASASHVGRTWGVMENGQDAVGVGGGEVLCWDGAKEFLTYVRLQNLKDFLVKRQATEGLLYFGQSQQDASMYSKWLNGAARPKVIISDYPPAENAEKESRGKSAVPPSATAFHNFDIDGLRLTFADAENGFAVLGLKENGGGTARFLEGGKASPQPLWKAVFRAGTDEKSAVVLDSKAGQGEIRREGDRIVMEWRNLSLGDGAGSVDVTATVSVKGRASDWRIVVKTNSDKYGLWESEYPIIGKVFDAEQGSTLLPTGNLGGTLRHNVPCSFNGKYPSMLMPVQFLAFMRQGKGLYVGIHDGLAMDKMVTLSFAQTFSVKLPAENMGVPGAGRDDLFPVRLQLYDGDWWTAAKLYRAWASKQQWTSRGRTFDNPKFPSSLADVSFWMQLNGNPEEVERIMIPLADKAGYPIGVHWYNWNVHPFDTHYPNMLPAREKMAEAVMRMREHNIAVMPYINGRRWDSSLENYQEALRWACKNEQGKPSTTVFPTSYIELAVMCPYTTFYKNAIHDIAMSLFHEKHVNALYLDEIGAAGALCCFDKAHGHPVGGGRFWTAGYRELLKPLRKYADEHNYFLTTENTAEPYIDSIDSFLPWYPNQDTDVPVLTAVYSGYTTYFSTPTQPLSDVDLSLRTQHGRNFLWGVVVGWNESWILKENFKDELDFDLMLGAHRHATKDFMVHGELLGELQPTEDVPSLDVTWHYRVPHDVSMPAVQGTVWEALDGRRCVYILNYEDSINSFSFKLPVPDGKAPWLLRRITPNGCAPLALVDSDNQSWTAHLKPQELLVLSMEKAEGRARAILKEAKALVSNSMDDAIKNAASQFIVSQNNKARLHIGSCMEFVKGESADFEYFIENSGKAAKLEIIWPNGLKEKKKVPAKSNERHVAMLDMSKMESGIGTVTVGDGKYSYAIPVALREVPAISAEIDLPSKMFAGERTYAQLTVSNNSRHTKEATIVICAPESWHFLPSRTIYMQNLRGKSKRHFNVGCVIGEQPEDSAEQIQLLVQQNIGASAVSVLKTRPKVIGHAATITIDGKLDEWSDTDIVTIDESCKDKIFYTKQGQKYGGNGDHSVRSRVAWDADCLYFAFEVTDDIHVNPSRDEYVWNGDMIQIELMPNGPAEKSSDSTVRQFAFACDDEGPFMYQWIMSAEDGSSLGNGVQKSCRIACARGANGNVTYEAAVPWKALQLEPPKANSRFGYSFVVSDNDQKDMKGWLQLTPGIFGEHNPAEIGWLILRQ